MKNSQIRVCGRAAQTEGGKQSAVLCLCFASAAAASGFMNAGAQTLLKAEKITSVLSSVSFLLTPTVNILACLLPCILISVLCAPIVQGLRRYFLLSAQSRARSATECVKVFSGRRYFAAFRLEFTLKLINILSLGFFLLPGALLLWGGIRLLFSSGIGILTAVITLTGSALLIAAGFIFRSAVCQLWAATGYIAAGDPDISTRAALKSSYDIMRGHCLEFIRFKLGFTLWFLSCVLIFPALFVIPYYGHSCAVWMCETVNLSKKII